MYFPHYFPKFENNPRTVFVNCDDGAHNYESNVARMQDNILGHRNLDKSGFELARQMIYKAQAQTKDPIS